MQITYNLDKRGYTSKPQGAEIGAINNRVRHAGGRVTTTPEELINHIKAGYTFTPAEIGGSLEEIQADKSAGKMLHYWRSQQIIVADIDNEKPDKTAINHPLTPKRAIEACKAAGIDPYCIYKTFSYSDQKQKFRVLIILEEPLTDAAQAADYISRFCNLFNAAIESDYKAAGETPENCADSTIEPVKLIFGGRADSVLYQTASITPIDKLAALPKTAVNAPISASNQKRDNLRPNASRATTGAQGREEELIEALYCINPAQLDYKDWLKIGAALKYEGIDYAIFDNWSAQDASTNDKGQPRYNEEANYKTWLNFSDSGRNTAKGETIFYIAYNRFNWQPSKYNKAVLSDAELQAVLDNAPAPEIQAADFPPDFFEPDTMSAADPIPEEAYNPENMQEPQPMKNEKPASDPTPAQAPDNIIQNAAQYLAAAYDLDIEELKQYAGRKMGLHPDIDKYLTLYPGLAILGGQASLGKTTFAVNTACKLLERGEHVLFFSLEQTTAEIMTKFAARYIYEQDNYTQTDNIKLKNGLRDSETCEYLGQLTEKLANLYIIESNFEATAQGIISTIDTYIKTRGVIPIVIIDYLQIIAPPEECRSSSKTDYIDENLKALKKWQKENGIFILLLSSFNRANNYEPVSYESFLYTSAIEFTCDYVFGLQLQLLDPDNEDFYIKKGIKGGEQEQKSFEKKRLVHEAQAQINPKKVQFVSLKNRNGKQLFKANFDYYPAHDFFTPDYSQEWKTKAQSVGDPVFDAIRKAGQS